MRELVVTKNEAGQRFDKYLLKYLNKAGAGFIYKMLRKKNIVLNDKKANGNEILSVEDNVKLYLSEDTIISFREDKKASFANKSVNGLDKRLDIIYEDDNVLLINKPCGILSQKAQKDDISINDIAVAYLLKNNPGKEDTTFIPSICNRLDRNTTGIIVVGKSLIGLQTMSKLFKDRTIHKYYLALVDGVIKENSLISGFLTKDSKTNKVSISKTEKRESDYIETYYEPIKYFDNMTLLKVCLITGKTHQIRAHLSSIGHPILGDYKYGNNKLNETIKKKCKVKSQLLHSYILEFPELDGELSNLSNKTFKAPIPKYWPISMED